MLDNIFRLSSQFTKKPQLIRTTTLSGTYSTRRLPSILTSLPHDLSEESEVRSEAAEGGKSRRVQLAETSPRVRRGLGIMLGGQSVNILLSSLRSEERKNNTTTIIITKTLDSLPAPAHPPTHTKTHSTRCRIIHNTPYIIYDIL